MNVNDLKIMQKLIADKKVNIKKLTGDMMITADYHNPCADLDLVDAVLRIAHDRKLKTMIIVGDYINLDVLSAYSRKIGGNDKDPKLSAEMDMGRKILDFYAHQFEVIYYLLGNHEARFMKAVNYAIPYDVIIRSFEQPKLRFIDGYYCFLDKIRLTHPHSYSQIKLSVATRLCDKYSCDVIQAHGHFCSMGYSRGGYRAVDLGCMADWERIDYMTGADTTHPRWNNGFAVYCDKQIYVYGKGYGL